MRTEEQPYAFLNDKVVAEENRYGQKIDLVDLTGLPREHMCVDRLEEGL